MKKTENQIFSVCIFIYKNLEGLERTIKSIAEQTYQNIELFISDDHSCECAFYCQQYIENILKPYREKFLNIFININQQNLGTVKHINKILPQVSGEYLCLLGSGDCLYRTETLKAVVDFFIQNPYDICFSKCQLNLNKNKNLVLPEKRVIKAFYKKDRTLLNLCCREVNHLTTVGSFFKRDLFEKYGYFDEGYILLEDAPFFLNLLFQDIPIGFIDEITCLHEKGGVSNQKKMNAVLAADSLKTLIELKYPNRNQLTRFTKRVVIFKYCVRAGHSLKSKLLSCFLYPDAALFLAAFITKDWFKRIRYL